MFDRNKQTKTRKGIDFDFIVQHLVELGTIYARVEQVHLNFYRLIQVL